MKGVEEFVTNNFGEHDSTFNQCLNLIVYGYSLLEKQETYSRTAILNITTTVRGKTAKKVELEDYLRNDLVQKYIEPNRKLFGLDYWQFHSGAEEFVQNIKTGILDIKVTSPLFTGSTYFIFECKRLNKTIMDNYVTEGVQRFVDSQYYPESETSIAGMISFLEASDSKDEISYTSCFSSIDTALKKHKKKIKLKSNLSKVKLICTEYKYVQDFQYVFLSSHNRVKAKSIEIYHLVFNYNTIVIL